MHYLHSECARVGCSYVCIFSYIYICAHMYAFVLPSSIGEGGVDSWGEILLTLLKESIDPSLTWSFSKNALAVHESVPWEASSLALSRNILLYAKTWIYTWEWVLECEEILIINSKALWNVYYVFSFSFLLVLRWVFLCMLSHIKMQTPVSPV